MKITASIFKTLFLCLCIIANTHLAYAQTASILPQGKTQFLDNNGKPLTSGTVDFYIPSTTTRKTTWQNSAETIANANPVVLDAGGRAIIYGDGAYRQVVKDRLGNIIWDQVTSSTGSGSGGSTATGDGDLVGTIKPWAGMTAPNQYVFTYGQEISRTTYSALFTAITSSQSVFCTSGSPTLTGLSDTTNFWVGMSLEVSCVAAGFSTVVSKTSSSITLASNANVSTNVTAIIFPWGRGNGTTTFNVPDLRGFAIAGNNNMGGVASSQLNTTYFGATDPNSVGAAGGSQSKVLLTANLPPYTPAGAITNGAITITQNALINNNVSSTPGGGYSIPSAGAATISASQAISTFAGAAQGGTSTAFSLIQPTKTSNYIIKITPDTNSATASGVTSLGSMTGDIACGTNVNCTGNIISFGGTGTAFLRDANPSNMYVTTTGNDSNTCLVGFPCLTIQRAVNQALGRYDFQGANLTINVGAGSFAGATAGGAIPGGGGNGALVIKGAGSGSTTITSTLRFVNSTNAQIGSMRITTASGSDVLVQEYARVMLADGDIDFGPAVTALVNVSNTGSFLGQSTFGFKISGGAQFAFLVSTNSVVQLSSGATHTITGTPDFSIAFVDALNNSSFNPGITSTWVGSATGQSYAITLNSSIDMEQSASPLPGSGYGTSDYSSYYYGVPGTTNESLFDGLGTGVAVTTGVRNTAYGRVALGSVSTSDNSTAMGSNALRLATAQNDGFGSQAARYVTSSLQNVAVGAFTLGGGGDGTALTGSGLNTAVGYAALQLAKGTSNTNTALGGFSLAALIGADSNVALGYQAGFATTSGFNTFVGANAGQYVSTGAQNIAVGHNSFQASSGAPITGDSNIGIGVGVALAAPANTNSIVIGSGLTGGGSNSVNLGGILTATGINVPASSTVTIPGTLALTTPLAPGSGGTGVANPYTLTIVGSDFSVTPSASGQWPIWSAGSLTGGTSTTITNAAAPASPAAGSVTLWTDSTDLRFHDKNAAGVIGTTVVADTGTAHNFLTAISAAGAVSKAQPTSADILATTTNDSAATGYIGQYTESVIASGSAVSLTTATPANLTSISLEAGDWDVSVKCNFSGAATTLVATLACGISTTSSTFDTTNGRSAFTYVSGSTAALYNSIAGGFPPPTVSVSTIRLSLGSTTTVYGVAGSQFGISTSAVYGVLSARRAR